MIIKKMFNRNIYISLKSNLKTYLTKDNLSVLIKTIILGLYILFNTVLFSIFMFFFILLYIKELTFGCIFKFKLISFICSIFWSWIDLFLLLPITLIPNLFILKCISIFLLIKNKLFYNLQVIYINYYQEFFNYRISFYFQY